MLCHALCVAHLPSNVHLAACLGIPPYSPEVAMTGCAFVSPPCSISALPCAQGTTGTDLLAREPLPLHLALPHLRQPLPAALGPVLLLGVAPRLDIMVGWPVSRGPLLRNSSPQEGHSPELPLRPSVDVPATVGPSCVDPGAVPSLIDGFGEPDDTLRTGQPRLRPRPSPHVPGNAAQTYPSLCAPSLTDWLRPSVGASVLALPVKSLMGWLKM